MAFVPNPAFIAEIERDPQVVAHVLKVASEGATLTREAAPEHTGHYRRSIDVERTATGARVFSTDIAANLIEFGSVNNPPYAPLRKGAELSGARYVDTGP